MLLYVLIGLSLSLAGVAGLQFFYMIYLERMSNEYQKRVRELEYHNKYLSGKHKEVEIFGRAPDHHADGDFTGRNGAVIGVDAAA